MSADKSTLRSSALPLLCVWLAGLPRLRSETEGVPPPSDLGIATTRDADGTAHVFPTPKPTLPTLAPSPVPSPSTAAPAPAPTPPTPAPLPDECHTLAGVTFCAPNVKNRTPFPTPPPSPYPTRYPTPPPSPEWTPGPTPRHAPTGAYVITMRGEIGGYTSPDHPSWHPAAKSTQRFLQFDARSQSIFRRTLAQAWRVPQYDVLFTVDARTDNGIVLDFRVYTPDRHAANWVVRSARELRMMLQVKLRSEGFALGSTTEAGNFEFLAIHVHERTKWEVAHGERSTIPRCNCDPFTETSTVTFCTQSPTGGHIQVTHELRGDQNAPPGVAPAHFVDLHGEQLRSHRCKVQWPSFNCKCCDCENGVSDHPPAQPAPSPVPPKAKSYAGYPPHKDEGGGAQTPGQTFHNPWLDVDSTVDAHQWHRAADEVRPIPATFRRRRT